MTVRPIWDPSIKGWNSEYLKRRRRESEKSSAALRALIKEAIPVHCPIVDESALAPVALVASYPAGTYRLEIKVSTHSGAFFYVNEVRKRDSLVVASTGFGERYDRAVEFCEFWQQG